MAALIRPGIVQVQQMTHLTFNSETKVHTDWADHTEWVNALEKKRVRLT
jgi:hypothetical protein